MTVRVEGLRELQSTIRKINKELGRELRLVNKRAAGVAKEGVDPLVPQGETGRLARSVGVVASQRGAAVKAGTAVGVPYAGAINFGWPAHNIEGAHFLEEGIESRLDEVADVYEVDIRSFLDDIDTKGIG